MDERDPQKQTGYRLRAWMLGVEATWKRDLRPQTPISPMVSWEMLACNWASYIIATHGLLLQIKLLQETSTVARVS